jgi:plastocyanin
MKHGKWMQMWSVLLLVVVVAAASVAGMVSAQAANATVVKRVAIKNMAFTAQTITVKAGTKVTWTNKDAIVHNVTSASSMKTTAKTTKLFKSSALTKGMSFSFTFNKKGTFFYECTIHKSMPSMHGKVIVT